MMGRYANSHARRHVHEVGLAIALWLLVSVSHAEAADGQSRRPTALRATVTVADPASNAVDMELAYSALAEDADVIEFQMPEHHAFVQLEEPLIEGQIAARDSQGRSLTVKRETPFRWQVKRPKDGAITLHYRVPLRHRTLPQVRGRDEYEYPYLDADHGMLVTATLFATPVETALAPISVELQLPEGWKISCPWPQSAPNIFAPTSNRALTNDLVAIGDWAVHRVSAAGMQIEVAFARDQELLEQAAVPLIKQIAELELKLFDDVPAPKYLFLFGKPETRGLGGSPKTNSMTLSVNPSIPPQMLTGSLGHLIAHEFFHLWGSSHYRCPDELRFFNEGFTDYYAYLIPARAGITSWPQFLSTLQRCMATCDAEELRGKNSLAAAGGNRFFTDPHARDLVYQGGLLVAALLDKDLRNRAAGTTLDDLMRSFNHDSRWSLTGTAPSLEDFVSVIEGYLGADRAAHYRRLITGPYSLDPVAEFSEVGVTVTRTMETPKLDLRGNLDGDPPTKLRDLDPNSIAFRVGIRSGDRFVTINGVQPSSRADVYRAWTNPADRRIRVTVERAGKQLEFDEPIVDRARFQISTAHWEEGLPKARGS